METSNKELEYPDYITEDPNEAAWLTLETRNLFVGETGPIFFREKVRFPQTADRAELAEFIRRRVVDLGERQAKFIEAHTEEEIAELLRQFKNEN